MGAKGKHIRASLFQMLSFTGGQFTCDLCRQLNGIESILFCSRKSCYANSRKRAKFDIKKCPCDYSLQLVRYHLVKLVKEGFLASVKEYRTDNYQNRGYDRYTCYYPI